MIRSWFIPIFFLLYLLLGWYIAPDYGVTWDEEAQRLHGLVALDYVADYLGIDAPRLAPERDFSSYQGRHYGLIFSMVCGLLEEALGLETLREQYLLRHRAVFLLNWLGSIFFFLLLRRRFRHSGLALLGLCMLVLSPRLFAHSFFNVKDMVLLPICLISLYFLQSWLLKPHVRNLLLFTFTAALALSVRMPALILPALALGLTAWRFLVDEQWRKAGKKIALHLALLLLTYPTLVVLFWPNLWEQPLQNQANAWGAMQKYNWNFEVRLFGEWVPAQEGAWYYLPAWIGITLPITYLLFFLYGNVVFGRSLKWKNPGHDFWLDAAMLSFFWGAVFAIYLIDAVLYDGWRHLFFIYPAIVYTAMLGITQLRRLSLPPLWKLLPFGLLAAEMLYLLWFSIRYHPHQQVYFNFLPGDKLTTRFEMDYWGSSYKQGLERLLEKYPTDTMSVFFQHWPGLENYHCLSAEDRARIRISRDPQQADFLMTTYRWRPYLEAYMRGEPPYDQEVFTIEVRGEKILGVYGKGKAESRPPIREKGKDER